MKKLNNLGFTLIELLAVITIMGILMAVAVPSISRTIENTKKDTYIDKAKNYVNSVKTMWASDTLECLSGGTYYVSTALPDGTYYVGIDTTSTSLPVLLEQGQKSSWGNRDVKGYVKIDVSTVNGQRKNTFYIKLADGIHGIDHDNIEYSQLKRNNINMTGQVISGDAYGIPGSVGSCREV